MATFTHNPLTWFHDDSSSARPEKERLASVIIERYEAGYSFYDWINFCDYISTLVREISLNVSMGKLKLPSHEERVALDIYGRINEIIELEADDDYSRETELLTISMTATVIGKFFTQVYPALSFDENYTMLKVSRPNLVADEDLATLGSFIAAVIASGLERFKTGHTYPGNFETPELWNIELDKMIESFNAATVSGKLSGEGFDLFLKYFENLWD